MEPNVRAVGHLRIGLPAPSRRRVLAEAWKQIRVSEVAFDAVAFRGVSGALFGPSIADAFKKALIVIRKENEQTHGFAVEAVLSVATYIIVDDLVDSGRTINTVLNTVDWAECVGIYLYRDDENGIAGTLSNKFSRAGKPTIPYLNRRLHSWYKGE